MCGRSHYRRKNWKCRREKVEDQEALRSRAQRQTYVSFEDETHFFLRHWEKKNGIKCNSVFFKYKNRKLKEGTFKNLFSS